MNTNPSGLPTLPSTEEIFGKILINHPALEDILNLPANRILASELIEEMRNEIMEMEKLALSPGDSNFNDQIQLVTATGAPAASSALSPALEPALLWVLSGVGTIYIPYKEKDRKIYKSKSWCAWMDKERHLVAGALFGNLHEQPSYAGRLIYMNNGIVEENENVIRAAEEKIIPVPLSQLHVQNDPLILNTSSQISRAEFPQLKKEGAIYIISHSPHLSRSIRTINQYKTLPPGREIVLVPVRTPAEGFAEYAFMEIEASIYYYFTDTSSKIHNKPHPYHVFKF